jgi:hypothetical protein
MFMGLVFPCACCVTWSDELAQVLLSSNPLLKNTWVPLLLWADLVMGKKDLDCTGKYKFMLIPGDGQKGLALTRESTCPHTGADTYDRLSKIR